MYSLCGVLQSDDREHRVYFPRTPHDNTALAAVIPYDDMAPLRTEATMRLWRLLSGKPRSGGSRLSNARRKRLATAMRALDGRLNGASYRDIARHLYDRKRLESEPWKTASLRTVTIRLVAAGFAMMRDEYRQLLRLH